MQFIVAKSASDPRWVRRGVVKSYDESKHPRDAKGKWTTSGLGLDGTTELGTQFFHYGRSKPVISTKTRLIPRSISLTDDPNGQSRWGGQKFEVELHPGVKALRLDRSKMDTERHVGEEVYAYAQHHGFKVVHLHGNNGPSEFAVLDDRVIREIRGPGITKAVPAESVDQVEQILRQVDQLDPRLRREFLAAVGQIRNQVDVDRIATMLHQGRVDGVVQYLNTVVSDTAWARVAHEVSAGMLQAIRRMPVSHLTGLDVSFSVTNPKAVQFLQAYEGDLIRELARNARASVMEAVRSGVTAGRNPLTTARDVRSSIGLTETQSRAVMSYRRALERGDAGNALGRALRDKRFDRTVRSARRNPLASEKIDQLVQRYADRYLKYRSETIGRTESIRGISAGNHMRWKQMVADGKIDADQVTRTWIYTHDSKTRAAHRAIPGLNQDGVGLDQPFDTPLGPLLFPGDPNGDAGNTINCRCTVFYRFKLKDRHAQVPPRT